MLGYVYGSQQMVLADLTEVNVSPHEYLLCAPCSERLKPPRGWDLEDRRTSARVAQEQAALDEQLDIRIVETPAHSAQSG